MNKDTEIVRELHIDDKTVHVHIHLTEDEMRRLLLPLVAEAFASELKRQTAYRHPFVASGTTAIEGTHP